MLRTSHLDLPLMAAAQSQKHITHNEALMVLDAVVQISVRSQILTQPPVDAHEGDRYIIASPANSAWLGHENKITVFQDQNWVFFTPTEGWVCWVQDDEGLYVYHTESWQSVRSQGNNPALLIGVNATADTQNRLAVSSENSLFSHEGTSHRVKINKATMGDSASVLYQDNWSGRAEIGLTGDDNFHFKVSPDGSAWKEAIILDNATGKVSMPQNDLSEGLMFNLLKDAGRFAGSPEATGATIGNFIAPTYLSPYNGSIFSAYGKFVHNNSTYGGTNPALLPEVDSLISFLKNNNTAKRYGPEFYVAKLTMGSGTSWSRIVGGVTRYMSFTNRTAPLWMKSSYGLNVKVLAGSVSIDNASATAEMYVNGIAQTGDPVVAAADLWKQIVWKGLRDPSEGYDYDNSLFGMRAETGTEFLIALPFIVPAQITPKPNAIFGRIGSLEAWR